MRAYWYRALRRAFSDTLSFLGFPNRARLVVSLVLFGVALVVTWILSGTQQMNEELRSGLAVVAAVGVLFVPTFLWNLLAAPVRMEREAHAEADRIAKDQLQRISAVESSLATVRGEFAEYRNKVEAATPALALGDPIPVRDQILERTHLVDDPSWSSAVSRPPQRRVPRENVGIFLWRIPVQNSGANADGVSVEIVKVTPDLPSGLANPTLHLAGDNPQDHLGYSVSRSFSLPHNATRQIDVIAMQTSQPHKCFIWSVASPDAVEEVSLNGSYKFTIRAFAGNAPSEPRDYQVDVDAANGNLTMTPLPTRHQEDSPTQSA